MYNEISKYLLSNGFQQRDNLFCRATNEAVGYQIINGHKQVMYHVDMFGVMYIGDGCDMGSGSDNIPVTHWAISDGNPISTIRYIRDDGEVDEKGDIFEGGLVQSIIVHSLDEFVEFINMYKNERNNTRFSKMRIF